MQRLMAEYGFPFVIWYGTLWLSTLGTLVALLHFEIVGWNDIVSTLTSPLPRSRQDYTARHREGSLVRIFRFFGGSL